MKKLTGKHKKIIRIVCEVELMTLKSLFGKRGILNNGDVDLSDEERLYHNEFTDSLLDTSNYFSKLKEKPDLLFEIDSYDAGIFLKVMILLSENGYIQIEGTEELAAFLKEKHGEEVEEDVTEAEIKELIKQGEGKNVEFKAALSYCFTKERATLGTNYIIAKAICSFLNSEGGVLIIGVSDNGEITGLENDFSLYIGDERKKKDLFRLSFDYLIHHFFDISVRSQISTAIHKIDTSEIFIVSVNPSDSNPVFLRNRDFNPETGKWDKVKKEFFIRGEASSLQIKDPEEMNKYIRERWK